MANPNLGGFISGISKLSGDLSVSAAVRALIGNQPMQNAPSAAVAVPSAQPQQPPLRTQLSTYRSLQSYLDLCPPGLTVLVLNNSNITSLQGVRWPRGLTELHLDGNKIKSLNGVSFPTTLIELYLDDNEIVAISGVRFPRGLKRLGLSSNKIWTLSGTEFPPTLEELDLEGNPLSELGNVDDHGEMPNPGRLINPNKYVIEYLKRNFAQLYFRDLYKHHKESKIAEKAELKAVRQSQKAVLKAARQSQKAELKAARQSQKAELHKMTDLSQQSIRNQLNAVTSFLHDGMAARAMEHNEQVQSRMGNKIFVKMVNGMLYYVPFSPTMTVQDVLDYLNSNYYVSALIPNHGAMSLMVGSKQLDEPLQRLADCNIQNESTLHAVGKMIHLQGGGTRRSSSNQRRSRRRRNKSIKKRT